MPAVCNWADQYVVIREWGGGKVFNYSVLIPMPMHVEQLLKSSAHQIVTKLPQTVV